MAYQRATAWNQDGVGARAGAGHGRVRRARALRLVARLPFAEHLVAAYYCAFDRATPFRVKATLFGALAYLVMPIDAIPDILPLLGFADDAALLLGALRMMAGHMRPEHREAARRWIDEVKRG
jgi:uncharacterized membrane protein YkvA (DUF1232 family)